MKILVTGGAGFVGRHVVAQLVQRGHTATALVRPTSALPSALSHPAVRVVHGDMRKLDAELIGQFAEHDAVIHLAATMSGTPRARFEGTVLATERMLAALSDTGWSGRLVHVSTLAVYAFNRLPRRGLIDESTPLESDLGRRGEYAWTKGWQERMVARYAENGGNVVIVRPGSIYGPDRSFSHRLGRQVGSRVLLLIGGFTLMPLSYVENVASLLVACAEHPDATAQVFNAIDPDPPRQWRYLRHLWPTRRDLIPVPVPLILYSAVTAAYASLERRSHGRISPPEFLDRYVMTPSYGSFRFATDKAQTLLSWTPPVTRGEAMRRTFGAT